MSIMEYKTDEEIRQEMERSSAYIEGFQDGKKCTIIEILAEIKSWENRATILGGNNQRAAASIKKLINKISEDLY